MTHHPAYDQLLEELANGELNDLQRNIFQLLKDNSDGLTREQLVMQIYGYMPTDVNKSSDDRKIRKAIERMRQRLFPIISTSSKPGYRLDTSRTAVAKMIGELQQRQEKIQEQINAAAKFYDIPVKYQEPVQATQMGLM